MAESGVGSWAVPSSSGAALAGGSLSSDSAGLAGTMGSRVFGASGDGSALPASVAPTTAPGANGVVADSASLCQHAPHSCHSRHCAVQPTCAECRHTSAHTPPVVASSPDTSAPLAEGECVTDEGGAECPDSDQSDAAECSICLQPPTYPVQLPCSHTFCFLCAKGCRSRCALCRRHVPGKFWQRPLLPQCPTDSTTAAAAAAVAAAAGTQGANGGFSWFYEGGRGGWWQYDVHACQQLERAFEAGSDECHLLLAGHMYSIDLHRMTQRRVDSFSRERKVKRDLATADKKGVAGLYLA